MKYSSPAPLVGDLEVVRPGRPLRVGAVVGRAGAAVPGAPELVLLVAVAAEEYPLDLLFLLGPVLDVGLDDLFRLPARGLEPALEAREGEGARAATGLVPAAPEATDELEKETSPAPHEEPRAGSGVASWPWLLAAAGVAAVVLAIFAGPAIGRRAGCSQALGGRGGSGRRFPRAPASLSLAGHPVHTGSGPPRAITRFKPARMAKAPAPDSFRIFS